MSVCLVIIAKNESHVIGRAIESARNFVDHLCVIDTGSSREEFDAMGEAIEAVWDKAYIFHRVPWIDFAHNRTQALRIAEKIYHDADWLFMMDADDYIEQMTVIDNGLSNNFAGYNILVKSEDIAYPRTQIFRAGHNWHYRGVVHEFPQCDGPGAIGSYPITVRSTREGDRNRDGKKYLKDAALLEEALMADTIELDLVPRYTFYLAQSYDGAGEAAKASEYYWKRAEMSEGYTEERYVSIVRNMKLMIAFDIDYGTLVNETHRAQSICPHRREAVALAMNALNEGYKYRTSFGLWHHYPTDGTVPVGLFIEPDVYTHLLYDRAAVAAHYCHDYKVSLRLNTLAIKGNPTTPLDVKRIADNMRFAIDAL